MPHSRVRILRRPLAVLAAGSLSLTMAACSADTSETSSTANPTRTAPSDVSISSSSSAASPSATSRTSSASPVPTLSEEESRTLVAMVQPASAAGGASQAGGASIAGILQAKDHDGLRDDTGSAGRYTVRVACSGGAHAAKLRIVVTPSMKNASKKVTKTFDCPGGKDAAPGFSYGKEVYSGTFGTSRDVAVGNESDTPVKFAIGLSSAS